jgi:flagellar basal-body rod modification protein FlgD
MSSISSLGGSAGLPATAASFAPAAKPASQSPDFLKLLMVQMQNQNPMSPRNSNEFMSQMAQFSTVQGITQLNQSINSLVALQGLSQGAGLIGKSITYSNASGGTSSGTVGSVAMVNGQPHLVVSGTNVSLSQILTIKG